MSAQSLRVLLLRLLRLHQMTILHVLAFRSLWMQLIHTSQLLTVRQTFLSLCLQRTYSQSQVVVLLQQVEQREASLRLTTLQKWLVLRMKSSQQFAQVSRCSVRSLTMLRLVTTQVASFVVFRDLTSREVRFLQLPAQSSHTQSSQVRFTFFQRTRVAVILHSSTTIVHSSISEQLT